MTAYAGFGICLPMGFNQHVRSWLDASGSWVQVFARGGGELGHKWHLSGTGPGSLAGAEDILSAVDFLRCYATVSHMGELSFCVLSYSVQSISIVLSFGLLSSRRASLTIHGWNSGIWSMAIQMTLRKERP